MGIIWDITRWGKTAADKVKSVFTQQPTTVAPKKTLDEEIIWQRVPTVNVGSFANTLNNQINTGEIVQAPQTGNVLNFSNSGADALWWSVTGIDTQEDELNGFQKLVKNISNFTTRSATQSDLQIEYNKNKKGVYVWYNPSLNSVYELRPVDEWAFNYTLSAYIDEMNKADTYEEQLAARDNFIKNVSWQFIPKRVPLGGPINKWMSVWGVSRDKFTDEQLNSLMGKNVWPGFSPTEDMIWDYVDTIFDNDEISRGLQDKYKDRLEAWLDEVDLNETESANAFVEKYTNIAKKDTLNLIRNNITSEQRWAAERNVDEIVSDQINRLLTSEMYLKGLRDEAALTPELQRTQWERDMIYNYDVVWKQLMDKLSNNINDYLLLQLNEWVDDRGQISDALWKFEDGRQLNDILRDWLADIAGIEIEWWGPFWVLWESLWKVSAIDIMRKFANEAAYNYKQWQLRNAWWYRLQRWRNWLEHGYQQDLWYRLGEGGQMLWRATVKTVNTLLKAPQLEWWWNAPSAAFLDADVSVGKLIETDDSPNKRTIKKYALQFWEYIPEWLWASSPDLALTLVTQGWTAPILLRHIPAFSKLRNFKRISNAIKEWKTIATTIDNSIKWLERVRTIWRQRANINSRNKRIWNIVDRTLSQFAVWQSMDAKLSTFDTEPYSDTSFWLSMWGSLLWDILPEAKDIWWVMRTWLKWWRAWTKWTWVWDLVDFINQSDENALLIAQQMWKNTANFSEQDLKNYIRAYATVTEQAKRVYNELTAEWKAAANSWTKELMYNYVKQAYLPNSRIWKAVKVLVENQATSPADIIKYLWNVPWAVSIWPYQSVIKLKQWTMAWVQAKEWWWYDVALDIVDGWFGNKVSNGFTFKDIQDISKINGYDDVLKNRDKYFRKVTEKIKDRWGKDATRTRWVLSEDWLDKFWLETKNLTLASLWIEISWAENVKEIFKEKMKWLEGMKLSNDTIDALADNWGYNEVVSKIENVLC